MYGSPRSRRLSAAVTTQYPQQQFYLVDPDVLIQGPMYYGDSASNGAHGSGGPGGSYGNLFSVVGQLFGLGKRAYDQKMASMTAEEFAYYEQQMKIEKEKQDAARKAQFQENLPFYAAVGFVAECFSFLALLE